MANEWPGSVDDLRAIVQERTPETVHLEFKRQLPDTARNADLAKDVAAMANTDGGVIVYGIDEDGVAAKALAPFALRGQAERINSITRSRVDEPLSVGVSIIESGEGDGHGYLVVRVPRSARAPHVVEGVAWCRTEKGNAMLGRRQIGELFARSDGFAAEFGVKAEKPARVAFRLEKLRVPATGTSSGTEYSFVFNNDGEETAFGADWRWSGDAQGRPPIPTNQFPIAEFHPGQEERVRVHPMLGTAPLMSITTQWRDSRDVEHELTWPVSWA